MIPLSIVIIAKNEEHIIGKTMVALEGLTDDIIIVDSGSTDNTTQLVEEKGGKVIRTEWKGYGATKNIGAAAAKYDWILSLDADEIIDDVLRQSIIDADYSQPVNVFELRFSTYFGERRMRYGEWGRDERHVRIFNKNHSEWNTAEVHEQLRIANGAAKIVLDGYVKHFTIKDLSDYSKKTVEYAILNAENYFKRGKKVSWLKLRLAPSFSFLWNYFIRLGFMDGHEGYIVAKMTAFYTFLKYAKLNELNATKNKA